MEAIQVAAESRFQRRSMLHGLGKGFLGVMNAVWLLVLTSWNASIDAEAIRKYRKVEWGEEALTEDTLAEDAYITWVIFV